MTYVKRYAVGQNNFLRIYWGKGGGCHNWFASKL
jgi:hypothetical protein